MDGNRSAPERGAGTDVDTRAARRRPPTEFVVLVALVALLSVGIVLAWTFVGSKSPERLDRASAAALSGACDAARAELELLPNPSPVSGPDRVARIRAENRVLRAMVTRFDAVQPEAGTPGEAVRAWGADWRSVVDARERYASSLETEGRAQFVLPADDGIKPVTKDMDDFVRQNHPHLDACLTERLALDTVEGQRDYGEAE